MEKHDIAPRVEFFSENNALKKRFDAFIQSYQT